MRWKAPYGKRIISNFAAVTICIFVYRARAFFKVGPRHISSIAYFFAYSHEKQIERASRTEPKKSVRIFWFLVQANSYLCVRVRLVFTTVSFQCDFGEWFLQAAWNFVWIRQIVCFTIENKQKIFYFDWPLSFSLLLLGLCVSRYHFSWCEHLFRRIHTAVAQHREKDKKNSKGIIQEKNNNA